MILYNSLIITSSLLSCENIRHNEQMFYFDGDYSQIAQEYYSKDQQRDNYDSKILYDIIAKEIEQGKHNLD